MPGPRSNPFGGKTKFDKKSGKWARHLKNQEKRAGWNREYMISAKSGSVKELPYPKIGF